MQLRTIFDARRFAGCVNARANWACFHTDASRPLSVFVLETPDGARLMVRDAARTLPLREMPLPPHQLERIDIWERWASRAIEREFEQESSLYGLECYGVSIAVALSIACPDRPVDYCGLPVHDEYAVWQFCSEHAENAALGEPFVWDAAFPRLPLDSDKPNRYCRQLLREAERVLATPAYWHGLWHDADWCYSHVGFEMEGDWPKTLKNASTDSNFPDWLNTELSHWEDYWSDRFWTYKGKPEIIWEFSPLIQPFILDALAVDVARFIAPAAPVSCSNRYVTGQDILSIIHPDTP